MLIKPKIKWNISLINSVFLLLCFILTITCLIELGYLQNKTKKQSENFKEYFFSRREVIFQQQEIVESFDNKDNFRRGLVQEKNEERLVENHVKFVSAPSRTTKKKRTTVTTTPVVPITNRILAIGGMRLPKNVTQNIKCTCEKIDETIPTKVPKIITNAKGHETSTSSKKRIIKVKNQGFLRINESNTLSTIGNLKTSKSVKTNNVFRVPDEKNLMKHIKTNVFKESETNPNITKSKDKILPKLIETKVDTNTIKSTMIDSVEDNANVENVSKEDDFVVKIEDKDIVEIKIDDFTETTTEVETTTEDLAFKMEFRPIDLDQQEYDDPLHLNG